MVFSGPKEDPLGEDHRIEPLELYTLIYTLETFIEIYDLATRHELKCQNIINTSVTRHIFLCSFD